MHQWHEEKANNQEHNYHQLTSFNQYRFTNNRSKPIKQNWKPNNQVKETLKKASHSSLNNIAHTKQPVFSAPKEEHTWKTKQKHRAQATSQ